MSGEITCGRSRTRPGLWVIFRLPFMWPSVPGDVIAYAVVDDFGDLVGVP